MSLPLEGIRVANWTIRQMGPVATFMLGDLGAEIMKIEDTVTGDPARGAGRSSKVELHTPTGYLHIGTDGLADFAGILHRCRRGN